MSTLRQHESSTAGSMPFLWRPAEAAEPPSFPFSITSGNSALQETDVIGSKRYALTEQLVWSPGSKGATSIPFFNFDSDFGIRFGDPSREISNEVRLSNATAPSLRDAVSLRLTLALNAIDAFATRQPNWDGMDGSAPNEEARKDAKAFLNLLHGSLPDKWFAPGDGEIAFQWRRERLFIEAGFFGDATISWFVRNAQGEAHGDDAYDRTNPRLPQELALALSKTFQTPMAMLLISVRRGRR